MTEAAVIEGTAATADVCSHPITLSLTCRGVTNIETRYFQAAVFVGIRYQTAGRPVVISFIPVGIDCDGSVTNSSDIKMVN